MKRFPIIKMFCPKCGELLIPFGLGRYETLLDHVSDPNGEYDLPERLIYTCVEGCLPKASFYGMFGGWYSSSTKREIQLRHAWWINKVGPLADYFFLLLRNEEDERYGYWPKEYWEIDYEFINSGETE